MDAGAYDAWYHTPRGAWIGEIEFQLLRQLLRPECGQSLLDVGCGTGYFTRRFAGGTGLRAVGLDPNASWLEFARASSTGSERYCLGTAESLPFADRSFDLSVSITALCFVDESRRALQEMLRVTRKHIAAGLLNRHSLLYYTTREIRALCDGLSVTNLPFRSAVFRPGGGRFARRLEPLIPDWLRLGAFIVAAGDETAAKQDGSERPHSSELGGCAGGLLRPSRDCRPSGLAALKLPFANYGSRP